MGYYSSLDGEIMFSRSINRGEAEALKPVLDDVWNVYELMEDREERETDGGTLTLVRTTGIGLKYEDQVKAYEWERVLRELVNALPADVTCSGYFQRLGEEQPDMERLYVLGRDVVSVKPEIVWPEPKAEQ
jgi:hypothetical protein